MTDGLHISPMMKEIERKFLVAGDFKASATSSVRIIQGYLSSVPERTVRIRIMGEKGFITVKGRSSASGASRLEWEREIPKEEASALLELCEPGVIDKERYMVKVGESLYEVDEFYGDNEGLTVAEIELEDEDQPFDRPEWLADEVTGDARYYNSMLMRNPYKNWK